MVSTNDKIGKWSVLRELPRRGKHRFWECQCSCATVAAVRHDNLIHRRSTQCSPCGKQARAHPIISQNGQVRYSGLSVAAKVMHLDKRTLADAIESGERLYGHKWVYEKRD